MSKKRYLRRSAVDTWKMASYEPVPPPKPEPEAKPVKERLDRRLWSALRRI